MDHIGPHINENWTRDTPCSLAVLWSNQNHPNNYDYRMAYFTWVNTFICLLLSSYGEADNIKTQFLAHYIKSISAFF